MACSRRAWWPTRPDLYRDEQDPLSGFLSHVRQQACHLKVTAKALYQGYVGWCAQNGEPPLSQKAVGMRLTERGFTRRFSGVWWIQGLTLKDGGEFR